MADRAGQQLGNYRLVQLLGKGGFAEVYLGEHVFLKSTSAIKVLHARVAEEGSEQFLAEAQTIARLIHPNIVRILDFGISAEDNTPFLVMDYAPNGTLRKRHPRGLPVPLPVVVEYTRQVANALQYAHNQKLIHRDVKPENMLFGRNNEVLLSDFGIAVIAHSTRSQTVQDSLGTLPYIAPEQIQGKARPASDQYALGIVVYEWLCGARPFNGTVPELISQHLSASPPSLRQKVPAISSHVEQVVMTALAKDPQQRFVSVQAFANALQYAVQLSGFAVSQAQSGPLPMPAPSTIPLYGEAPGVIFPGAASDTAATRAASPPTMRPPQEPPVTATPSGTATQQTPVSGVLPPSITSLSTQAMPADSNLTSPYAPAYALLTGIALILMSFALNLSGKLSPIVAYIAAGSGGVLALLAGTWGLARNMLKQMWRAMGRFPVYAASAGTIIFLTVLVLLLAPALSTPTASVNKGPNSAATSSGSGTTPIVNQTNTTSPTTGTSPVPGGWHAILTQPAPDCNNPAGVAWQTQTQAISLACNASSLLMQQIASQTGTEAAEIDLSTVNNTRFNLTAFRVQVQITFQNPSDTGSDRAGILVVASQTARGIDGYLVSLGPDVGGVWEIRHLTDRQNVLGTSSSDNGILDTSQPGTPVTPGAPAPLKTATLTIEVQGSTLKGYVNGNLIVTQIVGSLASPALGLVVFSYAQQSNVVQYSNFELDAPGNG